MERIIKEGGDSVDLGEKKLEKVRGEQIIEKRRPRAVMRKTQDERMQEEKQPNEQRESNGHGKAEELNQAERHDNTTGQNTWAKPGVRVKHGTFGDGVIKEITPGYGRLPVDA